MTSRAKRSASIIGSWWIEERRLETVDLPEAIPPVRPTTGDFSGCNGPETEETYLTYAVSI